MKLSERIQLQGNFLSRNRGFVPLLLLPAFYFALRDSQWIEERFGDRYDDVFDWLCMGLSGLGLALRVATAGFDPAGNRDPHERMGRRAALPSTTGLYSVVRNPLYLANTIVLLGFFAATGSPWFTTVGLLAACLHYERVIFAEEALMARRFQREGMTCDAEEAFLARRFQSAYRTWIKRTPAFVPRLSRWTAPDRHFCWRTALRHEHRNITGTVACFAVLDYAEDAIGVGAVVFEHETTALGLLGLTAFFLVRFIHKCTRVLHVAGR